MSARGQAGCVLIVDDEEDIRETLREAIEMIGCTAITAANGAIALKMLETHRPCLIVLDLLMPVMTGQEMLEVMRNEPELASLPVLVSTSAPCHAPAGVPILPKPIDLRVFWSQLRQICRCLDKEIRATETGQRESADADRESSPASTW